MIEVWTRVEVVKTGEWIDCDNLLETLSGKQGQIVALAGNTRAFGCIYAVQIDGVELPRNLYEAQLRPIGEGLT